MLMCLHGMDIAMVEGQWMLRVKIYRVVSYFKQAASAGLEVYSFHVFDSHGYETWYYFHASNLNPQCSL
ncbi:hypothetical protein AAY473_034697 [Plecturocebus cupreus]